jgi:hypothetical protein
MLVWAPEPRERMVYVNGHRYVEGETLANGAILQRIEQDGIIVIQAGHTKLRSRGAGDDGAPIAFAQQIVVVTTHRSNFSCPDRL